MLRRSKLQVRLVSLFVTIAAFGAGVAVWMEWNEAREVRALRRAVLSDKSLTLQDRNLFLRIIAHRDAWREGLIEDLNLHHCKSGVGALYTKQIIWTANIESPEGWIKVMVLQAPVIDTPSTDTITIVAVNKNGNVLDWDHTEGVSHGFLKASLLKGRRLRIVISYRDRFGSASCEVYEIASAELFKVPLASRDR